MLLSLTVKGGHLLVGSVLNALGPISFLVTREHNSLRGGLGGSNKTMFVNNNFSPGSQKK